jgi:hypothetical protein
METLDERAKMLGELAGVLAEVGAEHALVGGLAVGYHGRVRATVDVDLLVPGRKLKSLAHALEARGYQIKGKPDMLRVFAAGANLESDEPIADLVSREANPVLKAAFAEVEAATVLGQRVNVVRRGALVALKFHAAISPERRIEDRYQDIADIGRIIAKQFADEDLDLARRIAVHMHPGATGKLEKLIDDLKSGRPVTVNETASRSSGDVDEERGVSVR